MSQNTVAQASSWVPTPQSTAAFHQQVNEVLTPQPEQLHLALPRFHFGDTLTAAMRDQQWRWERREQQRDQAQIELDEAEENEAQWRDWCEAHQEELINQNGGVL